MVGSALPFELVDATLDRRVVAGRLPFRFGRVTVTSLLQLESTVRIQTPDGRTHDGHGAAFAVPRWFRKDERRSLEDDVAELELSAARAREAWCRPWRAARSAFDAWLDVYRDLVEAAAFEDALVAGYGVALIERAVIDAVCSASARPFHRALRDGTLGFDAGAIDPELSGWHPDAALAPAPPATLALRHTIGLADTLWRDDVAARIADGWPESLEEDVRRYELSWFKIKVGGDVEADRARLLAIAAVLRACGVARPRATLDGNECYADLCDVAELLESTAAVADGRWLLDGLAYVEQPLPRQQTFEPRRNGAWRRVARFAPLVIDEADVRPGSLRDAWPLGYRGVSAKSCKGTFRAVQNRATCDVLAARTGEAAILCGEDLTTIPTVALEQDLALHAALGVEHVERNGHHYFPGLAHLEPAQRAAALAAHPDLYRGDLKRAELRIEGGVVRIASLLGAR